RETSPAAGRTMALTSPKMTATASSVRSRSPVVPGPTEIPSISHAAAASANAPARTRTRNLTATPPSDHPIHAGQGDHTKLRSARLERRDTSLPGRVEVGVGREPLGGLEHDHAMRERPQRSG